MTVVVPGVPAMTAVCVMIVHFAMMSVRCRSLREVFAPVAMISGGHFCASLFDVRAAPIKAMSKTVSRNKPDNDARNDALNPRPKGAERKLP
jgi:hypothetical protein